MSIDIVSIVLSIGGFVTALTAIITALKKVLQIWLDKNINKKIDTLDVLIVNYI